MVHNTKAIQHRFSDRKFLNPEKFESILSFLTFASKFMIAYARQLPDNDFPNMFILEEINGKF